MNGFELADLLDEYNRDGMPVLIISKAVAMLRQLQTQNDTLRHELDYLIEGLIGKQ